MEIIVSIIGKIGEILIEPVGRQCGYLVHYNSNIETLKQQVQVLEGMKKDVQTDIEAAERKGEIIRSQVRNWTSRVDGFLLEAGGFLESVAIAKFHNLASRYQISRKAGKKIDALKELKENGKFDRVSNPAPPPKTLFPANEEIVIFQRTERTIFQIMEALKDNKVNFIGIYGMGGVGKTTLVKEVARQAEEEKLFNYVAMAVVSQTVEVKNIQDQMAEMVGMKWTDVSTEQGRARQLRNHLENKQSILIILDDIWASLDLAAIGIPFGNANKGVKIIVTTRRRQVCDTMVVDTDRETSKIIHLDVLSKQESWILLKKNVGNVIESPTIKSSAEDICRECGGLPIALVTVGKAMRQKDPAEWKEAVVELKKSRPANIEGVEQQVYKCLKLSFEYLRDEEAKSIFKLCCLFPEDYDIDMEDLVRYGHGLGIFEDVRIQDARRRTHFMINNLKDSCLLLAGSREGCVKMHDVVRDVAKSMTSDIYFVMDREKKSEGWPNIEKLKGYVGISTIQYPIDRYPDAWDCPNLQIWLMERNYKYSLPPEGVLKGMRTLQVLDKRSESTERPSDERFNTLDITEWKLRRILVTRVQLSLHGIGCLANLRTLILMFRTISNITALRELKWLEILSLYGCEFEELVSEIGDLTNLKLLDLRSCSLLFPGRRRYRIVRLIFEPNVISRLQQLQELYVNALFNIAELKSLSYLRVLKITIKDSEHIPQDFIFPELEVFQIVVGSTSSINATNSLCLTGRSKSSHEHEEGKVVPIECFKLLLPRTNYLKFYQFENLADVLYYSQFEQLEELEVENCRAPEYIFEKKDMRPCLRRLVLSNIRGLKQIWKVSAQHFDHLQYIRIAYCHELNVIFHASDIAPVLVKLETLELTYCDGLEAIVAKDQEGEATIDHDLIFPHLRKLSLKNLPKLTAFCMDNIIFKWPSLEEVELYHCYNMKTLAAAMASDGRQSNAPNLKMIQVDGFAINLDGTDLNRVIQDHYKSKEATNAK